MQIRKWLALLVSAALALSLLAGCGGESVARSLLALLDGQYANVSVEMDPDLEADLRQALSETENDDEAAIRAALETLLGSTITFRYLGEGQQGDTAFDLIFYAGADPDKAAQSAYSQWNGTFSNLPDDGLYTAALAQVQTENGIWLLVQATVDKAGTEDKPEPASVTGISVTPPTKTQYNPGEPFDPAGMTVTAYYSDGSKKTISGITTSDKKGVNWSPANINDNPTTVTITYGGKTDTVAVKLITLESIEVTQNPNKTEYEVDESFEPDGMVVTAYYSDDSSDTIASDKYTVKINGNPVSSSSPFATAGSYTLTVTYTEGTITKTDTITITVVDKGYTVSEDGKTYTVSNTHGLQVWNKAVQGNLSLNCTLTDDIDLKGIDWTPIGTNFNNSYTGTFDGGGHTITGLTFTGNDNYVGLIGYLGSGGTVMNVVLDGVNVTNHYNGGFVGGVAGRSDGTIENCSVSGSVISTDSYSDAGGVVGWQASGSITGCSSSATVKGTERAGGVAGRSVGIIENCSVSGSVISTDSYSDAGGVVGWQASGSITGCSSSATVQGTSKVGGVVGFNEKGSVLACYATGDVTGSGISDTGGVVGGNDGGTVTACYHANGTVQDGSNTGGVVGYNNGTVNDCYWSGSVAGDKGIGDGSSKTGATKVGTPEEWEQALAALNKEANKSGYTFDGSMTSPTLKKKN